MAEHLRLLVKAPLVADNLDGAVLLGAMVVGFHNIAKGALAQA